MTGLYVQYGSGADAPDGWLNFDSSPRLRFERLPWLADYLPRYRRVFPKSTRYGNILSGLPIADGSCAGVYASHVLEHLTQEEAARALNATRRLLKPDGRFRVVVPDLEIAARRYVEARNHGDAEAAGAFLDATLLGERRCAGDMLSGLRLAFGRSRHLWMWDKASLEAALKYAGFVSIRSCVLGDSEDPMFQRVEKADRFAEAVAFEARLC